MSGRGDRAVWARFRALGTLPTGRHDRQRRHRWNRGPTVLVLNAWRSRTRYPLTPQRISIRSSPRSDCSRQLPLKPVDDRFASLSRHPLHMRLSRWRERRQLFLRGSRVIWVGMLLNIGAFLLHLHGLIGTMRHVGVMLGRLMQRYRLHFKICWWLWYRCRHFDGGGEGKGAKRAFASP